MSEPSTAKGIKQLADVWTQVFEQQYREKWARVIGMLVDKAGISMADVVRHTAGLIWIFAYDLSGAIVHKSIKSGDIANGLIDEIAREYKIDAKKLHNVMSDESKPGPPHELFQDICELVDPNYRRASIDDREAIQGFHLVAKQIIETSNLGYFFDHIGEITGSANAREGS